MKQSSSLCCKQWLEGGMYAVLPAYGDDGCNGSIILFEGGASCSHKRKVRTVIKELAELYQKDVALIKKQAGEILGQRAMIPLPITSGVVLVPFKVRKPVGKDDGAVGYVFESAVEKIESSNSGSVIRFKDGRRIAAMEGLGTAKRHMDNAMRMRKQLVYYSIDQQKMAAAWGEMRQEYEQPATRGDIAILFKNIAGLMEKLGL